LDVFLLAEFASKDVFVEEITTCTNGDAGASLADCQWEAWTTSGQRLERSLVEPTISPTSLK
jgi:hypothetical protein